MHAPYMGYTGTADTCLARFSVVVTARSHKKGEVILASLDAQHCPDVDLAVVEDVAVAGAVDDVFRSVHGAHL